MTDIIEKISRLEKLIAKYSAVVALYRLKISSLNIAESVPGQISQIDQFVQAHKTYIRYLENELEQLRSVKCEEGLVRLPEKLISVA